MAVKAKGGDPRCRSPASQVLKARSGGPDARARDALHVSAASRPAPCSWNGSARLGGLFHRLGQRGSSTASTARTRSPSPNVTSGDALGEISRDRRGGASAHGHRRRGLHRGGTADGGFPGADRAARRRSRCRCWQRWPPSFRDLDDKVSLVSSIGPEQRVYSELLRLARVEKPGSDRWLVPEIPTIRTSRCGPRRRARRSPARSRKRVSRGIAERRTRSLYINDYKA